MKRVVLLLVLFTLGFVSASISPGEVASVVGDKLSSVAKNTNIYAEALGENLLKFQTFFMGIIGFLSLGFLDVGGDMAFITFLFFILLFMFLYSIVGLIFSRFNFAIAFIITALAFIGMDERTLESIFLNYGAMGITITVVLPILILLAFTFKIYQRAYEGKSEISPFYAEMFNLTFLIFFGVFFIRHSMSEEGVISMIRFVSGWVLIGLGIGQTVLYKIAARAFNNWKKENEKEKRMRRKAKDEAAEKIRDAELGI